MYTKFITKVIQEKLKAKERALARKPKSAQESTPDGFLKIGDLASRTTFVRMCSNKSKVPNILISGGENNEKGMAMGFGETYRDRTENDDNSGIRGIPGIKDITVEYKGGFKAIRECIVNWTIPAIEDLDRLTPYFLTVGKSVVVDWGWNNAKNKSLKEQGIDAFISRKINTENNTIEYIVDQEIFSNPQKRILNSGGDYDAIGGIISNFNYNLRDDGGFDCTTIITAMGASLFHKPIDVSGNTFGTRKLKNENSPKHAPPDSLINCIINLKHIIFYDVLKVKHKKISNQTYADNIKDFHASIHLLNNNNVNKVWASNTNEYGQISDSVYGIAVDDKNNPNILIIFNDAVKPKIMVTWGWFEDQILNRYLSFRGGLEQGSGIKMTIRSIDSVLDENGKPITREDFEWLSDEVDEGQEKSEYQAFIEKYNINESTFDITEPTEILKTETLIRNPELLLPINPFKFHILEANFAPAEKSVAGTEKSGTVKAIEKIGSAIVAFFTKKITVPQQKTDVGEFWNAFFTLISDKFSTNFQSKIFTLPGTRQKGRLRNIWVNIEEIQKAFGIKNPNSKDNTSENISPPGTIEIAVKNLLTNLNSNFHNVWDFELGVDQFDSTNIKIIDKSDTNVDYPSYTKYIENSHMIQDLGIYRFPSFKMGSIVKTQNLEFKIPSAQALTILYGSNKKKGESDTQQNNAQLDKLFRMDIKDGENDVYADMYLNDLETSNFKTIQDEVVTEGDESFVGPTFNVRPAKIGSELTNPNSKIADGFGFTVNPSSKNYRWKKFEPNVENIGTVKTSKDRVEYYEIRKDSSNRPILQYIIAQPGEDGEDAKVVSSDTRPYYDLTDEGGIVLNQSAASVLNSFINSSAPIAKFDMNSLVPTELNLEIDGTGGILPGDIIHTEYIQHKYKANIKQIFRADNEEKSQEGPLCYFQLFGITQKVTTSGWTTELTSKMTINRMPEGAKLDYKVPQDNPKKPLGPTTNKVLEPPPEKPFIDNPVVEDEAPPTQIPAPPTRPSIPIPPDLDEDPEDVTLDDLDFDDIPPWLPPPYPSTLALRRAKQEVENKPERVPEQAPPDVPMIDIGPMMSEEDFLNVPDNLGTDASDNATDLVEYPPEPDPRLGPALPTTPLKIKRGGEFDLNPLSLLDQIKTQKIIYVNPEPPGASDFAEETYPTTTGEVSKAQRFEAPQVEELNWESPTEVVMMVNENIKQDKPEEIKVETVPKETMEELKSTYKGTMMQNNILYAIREDWRPLYLTGNVATPLSGARKDSDGNERTLVRQGLLKPIRQQFWDTYIEAPNKSGETKTSYTDKDNFQIYPEVAPTGNLLRRERDIYWYGEWNPNYEPPPS